MNVRNWKTAVWLVLLVAGAVSACRRTYVIVPRPPGGYRPDTLRATLKGNDARVIFRFDTVTRTRIVRVTDTLWRDGKQIIHDTVRLVRRDTVRVGALNIGRDTVRIVRRDTVRLVRVDTVRLGGIMNIGRDTVRIVRRDTVRVERTDTIYRTVGHTDTVRVRDTVLVQIPGPVVIDRRVDTVRVPRGDTVRITRVDTVRVTVGGGSTGGRRLFVPPGHYPPEGRCRIWIQDLPPGRQRDPAPCDRLGDIPAGAFILYGGMAWDFDYDWVAAGDGSAPPPIIALKRKP